MKKRTRGFNPGKIFIFGFLALIVLGAVVLSLPVSSKTGEATPFLKSLFTSVSATCITGLVVFDTFRHWSMFGQAVILFLIQTGGLGFMTFASFFSLVFRRSIGHKARLLMAQTLDLDDISGLSTLTKHIVIGTFTVEGCAALVLSLRFIPDFGPGGGIWRGVFIAISAFCNAGFDLMGTEGEFLSLTAYAEDITVNLTVVLLILIGGLGFLVWEDFIAAKKFKAMSVQTKIILLSSVVLVAGGFLAVLAFESGNPGTLGGLSVKGKILAALFQSVSPRTAGFNTVNLAALRETTKIVMLMLMFVGGASCSTAGGVKINTVAVLFFAAASVLRGKKNVTAMKRTIPTETVLRAFALASVSLMIMLVSSFALAVVEDQPFISAAFECVSAFCTVGLTVGITSTLSAFSLVMLMTLMFLGRIGLMTASLSLFLRGSREENGIRYPEAKISVG